MQHAMHTPTELPAGRILGAPTEARRRMLACIDVVVGYVCARHRRTLIGWHVEAALVEARPGFRGGETVAIRAWPAAGFALADLSPVPFGVLREIASRSTDALDGIANVVCDIATPAPDLAQPRDAGTDGGFVIIDEEPWLGGSAASA